MTTNLSAIAFKRVPFAGVTRLAPISERASATLAILDPFGIAAPCGAIDDASIEARIAMEFRALRRGGSVVVLVDALRIRPAMQALEAAGFKQLRYVEACREAEQYMPADAEAPVDQGSLYDADDALAAIIAVKSGGSKFNAYYHPGDFVIAHGADALDTLLDNLIRLHTDPGDVVRLGDAVLWRRIRDAQFAITPKPACKSKTKGKPRQVNERTHKEAA